MGDSAGTQVRVPRRTIFFASGETMEEYSTDEEDVEEPVKREVIAVDAVGSLLKSKTNVALPSRRVWSNCLVLFLCISVQTNLGSILLVPHVENGHLNYLR